MNPYSLLKGTIMDTNETPTLVTFAYPTVKAQIVQAGVGLGISVAITAVTLGTFMVFGAIVTKVNNRKDKKARLINE